MSQQAYLIVLESLKDFEIRSPIEAPIVAYINKTLKYRLEDYSNNLETTKKITTKGKSTYFQFETDSYKDELNSSDRDTFEEALIKIKKETLESLLIELTDHEYKIVVNIYYHHKTQESIADDLGITQQAVSKVLKSALTKMYRKLKNL